MKAFILAAGKGERMRPLTDTTPKPLLKVGDITLLDRQIQKLITAGIKEIIINAAYLSEQIVQHVKDRSYEEVCIDVSIEKEPLETAGAINHARELLGEEPFLLVNGDVWIDYDFSDVIKSGSKVDSAGGHLILVPNPEHKQSGDFCFLGNETKGLIGRATEGSENLKVKNSYTYSGISVLGPGLVLEYPQCRKKFPLVECFHWAIENQKLSASLYDGFWLDVGTPERLAFLRSHLLKTGFSA